ncbi:MAG: membrane protein insertion efficiency factor YidD [Candidatus Latescibacterota bacterium]
MTRILISVIRLYQAQVSHLFHGACIYTPSCSVYAVEALQRHGAWKGAKLSASRLLRCRPPNKGGYDPVT